MAMCFENGTIYNKDNRWRKKKNRWRKNGKSTHKHLIFY